jgi:hypothetical protein
VPFRHVLGRVCKFYPAEEGGDEPQGQRVLGPLLVAGGNPVPLGEALAQALHPIPQAIQGSRKRASPMLTALTGNGAAKAMLPPILPDGATTLARLAPEPMGAPMGTPRAGAFDCPVGQLGKQEPGVLALAGGRRTVRGVPCAGGPG